jgi:hypothetical protein
MPRRSKKIDNGKQLSLFEALTLAQNTASAEHPEEGEANIREPLRRAVVAAIKQCSLSRWEIAGKMSHLLGVEVTKFQLDAWTAESKEMHRVPAEYLPAFCMVTRDHGPLRLMAEAAGLFALPGPDALRAEIQRLDEQERKIKAEKRKRSLFLNELEGKNGNKL